MDAGERYRVVVDAEWGHRRLDPLPHAAELDAWYESRYYDLVRKGGRAPEIGRLLAGGPEGDRERAWLEATLYDDVADGLRQHAPGRRVLDVGCGTGDLVAHLGARGLDAAGVEPSAEAAGIGRSRGLRVHALTLEAFAHGRPEGADGPFDAVTLVNVLEHVPRPADLLRTVGSVLRPGGVVFVRVPNDFSDLQAAAHAKRGGEPWWIAVPDHINYFDFASLAGMLRRTGFEVVRAQGDFPMELFLLMGDDYVADREAGARCHRRRVDLEMSLPGAVRRRMYEALARAGMGRNAMVFARREP